MKNDMKQDGQPSRKPRTYSIHMEYQKKDNEKEFTS